MDIVERLRLHNDERLYEEADVLMSEAADEITRLRAELLAMTEKARKEYLSAIEWAGKHQELSEKLSKEYEKGRQETIQDTLDTLEDFAAACAGLEEVCTPSEAYDKAHFSLKSYYSKGL